MDFSCAKTGAIDVHCVRIFVLVRVHCVRIFVLVRVLCWYVFCVGTCFVLVRVLESLYFGGPPEITLVNNVLRMRLSGFACFFSFMPPFHPPDCL